MARKVIWSDEAIADLGIIVRSIAVDNRRAGETVGLAVFERTRMLGDFPLAGRVVPEERNPRVRELIAEPYRIIYEVNTRTETMEILRYGMPREAHRSFNVITVTVEAW